MPLYTFLMEFNGGTYIRQIASPTPEQACVKWAMSLDISSIVGLGIKGKTFLIEQMKDEELVPVNETVNTWCASALIRGKLALMTIIQTETENS